ncbi:hypothetical protein HPP92_014885 [Vanilla planifolia]|uniref:Uncharacterized protein n=1 Tax=Vanilla planifolia TaxID=51239 RepID=A0A835QSE9_VANPL|nr:hypothetical protein HPP92_014885 [Vanilla planifolia]
MIFETEEESGTRRWRVIGDGNSVQKGNAMAWREFASKDAQSQNTNLGANDISSQLALQSYFFQQNNAIMCSKTASTTSQQIELPKVLSSIKSTGCLFLFHSSSCKMCLCNRRSNFVNQTMSLNQSQIPPSAAAIVARTISHSLKLCCESSSTAAVSGSRTTNDTRRRCNNHSLRNTSSVNSSSRRAECYSGAQTNKPIAFVNNSCSLKAAATAAATATNATSSILSSTSSSGPSPRLSNNCLRSMPTVYKQRRKSLQQFEGLLILQ